MFGSQILEVAIGLIFVYLMFSLICSGFKEWLHYIFNIRSKSLEEAIHRMLGNTTLVEAIYSHLLVGGASQAGIFKKAIGAPAETSKSGVDNGTKPVDIPTVSFSKALLDSILKEVTEKGISKAGQEEYDKIRASIALINNTEIKKVLTDLLNDLATWGTKTEEELAKRVELVRSQVEKWFDASMQKLSLWYRKKTKQLIFVLAVVFIISFNVDTFMIVRTLSQDPQLRVAMVGQAEVLSQQVQNKTAQVGSTDNGITTAQLLQEINSMKGQLKSSGLPLGWVGSGVNDPRAMPTLDFSKWNIDWWGWIVKFLGLIITLLAVSMGSPFWFDVLRKLFDVRKKLQGGDSTVTETSTPVS